MVFAFYLCDLTSNLCNGPSNPCDSDELTRF